MEDCLRREDDLHGLLKGRVDNSIGLCRLNHLSAREGGLMVRNNTTLAVSAVLLLIGCRGPSVVAVSDAARNIDDVGSHSGINAVRVEILLGMEVAICPLARRRILAQEEETHTTAEQADDGHDEGQPPSLARGVATCMNKRVVNCGHDEVGDSTTSVTPAARQGIGGSNNILIEESSTPHLAGNESGTENTDEEAGDV